jgi:hypothetical protein
MNINIGMGTGSGTGASWKNKMESRQMRDLGILVLGLLYGTLGTLVLVNWKWPSFEAFCASNSPHEITVGKAVPETENDPIIHRITQSQAFQIQLGPK